MSHFNINRDPPSLTRPDPAKIALLDASFEKRRTTSLRTCHRPALRPEKEGYQEEGNAFVPQFSARLLNDTRLTDGARRLAAKLMEITYRRDRTRRALECTVSYLARALNRSERTIQNYLRDLRECGYVRHEVITSSRARMCIGILITLLAPVFPKHHQRSWPTRSGIAGVKRDSDKYHQERSNRRYLRQVDVDKWALWCMDGVFQSLMKTVPPFVMATDC
jgi:hypothetical protein